jgi:hypothetical protein
MAPALALIRSDIHTPKDKITIPNYLRAGSCAGPDLLSVAQKNGNEPKWSPAKTALAS